MTDDDLLAELMTELRVRRADVSRDGFVQGLTLGELMVLKRKWERAAAERERKWARVRFEYLQSAVNQILESFEDEQEEPSE